MDPRHTSPAMLLYLLVLSDRVDGFYSWTPPLPSTPTRAEGRCNHRPSPSRLASRASWSTTDDWSGFAEAKSAGDDVLIGNLIQQVDSPETPPSVEEKWLQDTVNTILQVGGDIDTNEIAQNDLSESFEDDMGDEISLLVRCNEQPQSMLIQEGRAVLPLTDAERDDPMQLVDIFVDEWVPSKFFDKAIAQIFETHARTTNADHDKVMDARSVASWFQQCLQPAHAIGPHDQRVLSILAGFSSYGTGYLTLEDMKRLYLRAVVGDDAKECTTHHDIVKRRSEALQAVWRDLRNHGILSPRQVERFQLQQSLVQTQPRVDVANVMDECELVYEKLGDRQQKGSHARVDLAADKKTPLWINDGEFVFIDEDSCIGCTNCALAAPASFEILDYDGRARTFAQRPKSPDIVAAFATCPVDCMHYVSFDELKELEMARDEGDGRQDHKHFGSSDAGGYVERKPLHVQRRESDASHRSSWYHYLKDKCCKSTACPERGCFDCPSYKSGSNPYFKERVRRATSVRAKHFTDMGVADAYRTAVDL